MMRVERKAIRRRTFRVEMIDGVREDAPLRALPRAWVGTTGEDRRGRARMLAGGETGMFLPRPLSQVKAVDRTRQWAEAIRVAWRYPKQGANNQVT
jgi:hypothetical protein